jgi:3-polyprenyl-4-hydroxybenzoate decarboxylase
VRSLPGVRDARIPEELGGWWLLIGVGTDGQEETECGDGERVIKALGGLADEISIPCWTVVVGRDADVSDTNGALFHWLAHTSPGRDRYVSVCGRRVAFDATPKVAGDARNGEPVRVWPPIVGMDPGTIEKVRRRWTEYFGNGAEGAEAR